MILMAERPVVHEPVMLRETLAALAVRPGGRYVDCTVDGGGHAEAILAAASPGGSLLGIDEDEEVLELARRRLEPFGGSVALVRGNFRNVDTICQERGFEPVNGIVFDLGLDGLLLGKRDERGGACGPHLALRRRAREPQDRAGHRCPSSPPDDA
jgi:16S rRNA (cytosine1402-N4)-methyltransferase